MILSYFRELSAGIEAKLATTEQGEPVARKRLTLEMARLGTRLFSGEHQVAWCGFMVPFDLLQALGVTSCFVEFVGAMLASTGGVPPMLAAAEEAGFPQDGCSYHRAVTGASLQGMMPEPAFLIGTSVPCAGGLAVIENLARHFDRDLFVIDVPQRRDETGVRYIADQLRAMVDFVADHTGRPLRPEALAAAVACSNRTRALLAEVYQLARAVPSPARPRDLVNLGVVMPLLLGDEAGEQVARTYRDELARTLAAREAAGGASAAPSELRLLWLQNRIQFKNPLERLLTDELGAAVVVDELNDVFGDPIDPDDPYTSMARRMLDVPLVRSVPERVEHLIGQARAYSVDGAINPCNWGCRQGAGARGLIERGLGDAGVPVLNLEVDCIDPRSFSEGQLRTRVEAFIEMLSTRRATLSAVEEHQ